MPKVHDQLLLYPTINYHIKPWKFGSDYTITFKLCKSLGILTPPIFREKNEVKDLKGKITFEPRNNCSELFVSSKKKYISIFSIISIAELKAIVQKKKSLTEEELKGKSVKFYRPLIIEITSSIPFCQSLQKDKN